jgi:DNA-binding transcriptional LysR family regulator
MELRQLQYFIAVAEELHFGHAAEREHLTQAALSQQVQRLERELGVRLLDRTTRCVQLTTAGGLFLDEARATLASAGRAADTARRAAKGEVGRLVVGYPLTGRGGCASALLRTFRTRYPQVELASVPSCTADLPEQLRHEQIDVAFLHHSIIRDGLLTSRTVSRSSYVLAIPAGHPLAGQCDVSVDDLAGQPLLLFSRQLSPEHHDQLMRELSGSSGTGPRVVEEASAVGDLIDGVQAGIGLALIVDPDLTATRAGRIAFRHFRPPAPTLPVDVAWRKPDRSPPVVAFLAIVDEVVDGAGHRRTGPEAGDDPARRPPGSG